MSATLAANEAMAARRARGLAVLPLAFGEAGLPVHPALRDALAAAAGPAVTARWPGGRRCGRRPRGTGPGAACPPVRARWCAARAASRCSLLLTGAQRADRPSSRPRWRPSLWPGRRAPRARRTGPWPTRPARSPRESRVPATAPHPRAQPRASRPDRPPQEPGAGGWRIWSAPAAPIQHAAALAFTEPALIAGRIAASRALHAQVAAAVAAACASAGLIVPAPQAGFYVYPDFEPWRDYLHARHQVTTSTALARLLLNRYGVATLPGSAFGEPPAALRLRLATALLYGDSPQQQEAALTAPDPTTLPWVAAALTQLSHTLTDLASGMVPAPDQIASHPVPARS